jgi:hypothetical protein
MVNIAGIGSHQMRAWVSAIFARLSIDSSWSA